MTNPTTAMPDTPRSPSVLTAAFRIFDLSLSDMLWSRRSVFLALVVGGPVIIALVARTAALLPRTGVRPLVLAGSACFLAGFGWLLVKSPLVPAFDPRLSESLAFENV